MTRLTLAAITLLSLAAPAVAQGYYEQNNQSIFGGPSGGYHWRETAPAYTPPPASYGYTQPQSRGFVCTQAGYQTYCN